MLLFDYFRFPMYMIDEILLMSAMIALAHLIFYSERELTAKQMLVRRIIHFAVVMTIISSSIILWEWVSLSEPVRAVMLIGAIVVSYALVMIGNLYYLGYQAKKATQKLKERYK